MQCVHVPFIKQYLSLLKQVAKMKHVFCINLFKQDKLYISLVHLNFGPPEDIQKLNFDPPSSY